MNKTKNIALAALPLLASCHTGAAQQPNIVFLLFDDLGYGDLGCYGQKIIETPNIDALAAQGLRFTDMYTACPLSAPSRCSIMTGKHSGHSQIRFNQSIYETGRPEDFEVFVADSTKEGQVPMLPGTPTLATMLKGAGYSTTMVGKWGLGNPGSESLPNKMGFDYFYGFICQRWAHQYYPPFLYENDRRVPTGNKLIPGGTPLDEGADPYDIRSYDKYTQVGYTPDLMYDKLEKFIEENADPSGRKPFIAMWTTTVPHSAVQAPADEVMHYVNKIGDEEPAKDYGWYYPNRYPHATYAAMISHIDTQVGKLVQKLKDLGVYENTLIIVTSDNGPASNGNSPMEFFKSGGPFKCRKGWGKSSLHEGGIRMPFIAFWDGHISPGVSDYMGQFVDLMPTFAELAGVKAPDNDGISFVPTLLGKPAKQKQHEYLYWEFPNSKGWVGVRYGKWKGFIKGVRNGNNHFELYDLASDPREKTDVSAEHPDIVEKMWKFAEASHEAPDGRYPAFNMDLPVR